MLAPDVVVVADGGGLAPAALRPFRGRARVANALSRFTTFVRATPPMTTALINGGVAARLDPGGEFDTAITFVIEDGQITQMHAIRNPDKLGRLDSIAELRR